MNQIKMHICVFVFLSSMLCSYISMGADETTATMSDKERSNGIIHSMISSDNKELADAVSLYITAIESADWEKAYALRSKRFHELTPITAYLRSINERSYTVHEYDVLSYNVFGKSSMLIVKICDMHSGGAFYSLAWWGKTKRGWVCIDDGALIFPFKNNRGISDEELANLLGEE